MCDDSELRMAAINILWMNCVDNITLGELKSRACRIVSIVKDAPKEELKRD